MSAPDEDAMDLVAQVEAVKNNVIGKKTVNMYLRGISRYVEWLYQHKRHVLSVEFLGALRQDDFQTDAAGVTSLAKDRVLHFLRDEPRLPPINYDLHRADDFEQFLMSLTNRKGDKPGQSVYDSMRSSLFHLYRRYGHSMAVDFAANLTVFFKGLKRSVARKNHETGVKLTEGKEALPFSVLRALCVSIMSHEADEFVFAHTFLLISWNLMCRAGNTASIHSGHISWENDALAIRFGHMKNDQDGTRPRDARHMYANPFIPEICPVLSLAVYAAVCGLTDSKLFPGGNQYDRFSKILRRLMLEPHVTTFLENEGLVPSDIGTHSARKGSATYVSSCSNGGPSAAAICIRAGWKLPGVQDTYIRYEAAGDMIVGRYVAGLPFEDTGFAILPPFFTEIDDLVRSSIDLCFSRIPPHLIRSCSFLLASLVYHRETLLTMLHPNHPLRHNALFGNDEVTSQLKERLVCRTANPTDRIRPTGVPPHVHMLAAIERQAEQLKNLTLSVNSVAHEVVSLMKTEMSGVLTSVTPAALDASISRALNDCGLIALLDSVRGNIPQQQHQSISHPQESIELPAVEQRTDTPTRLTLCLTGSRLTRVLSDFDVPTTTLECAWEHWCCGDPSGRLGPFRFLQWHDLSNSKKRKRLSHYRCMMMHIQDKIATNNWIERPTIEQARVMLDHVLPQLPISNVTAKNRQRRITQLKWSSVLQEIRKSNRISAST